MDRLGGFWIIGIIGNLLFFALVARWLFKQMGSENKEKKESEKP